MVLGIVFAPMVGGYDISPDTQEINISSGDFGKVEFDIEVSGNEIVHPEVLELPENISAVVSDKDIDTNKTISIYYMAGEGYEPQNFTSQINFTIEVKNVHIDNETYSNQHFSLDNYPVIENSEEVIYNGSVISGYYINYENGFISLDSYGGGAVKVSYDYSGGTAGTETKIVEVKAGEIIPEEKRALIEVMTPQPWQRGDWLSLKVKDNIDGSPVRGCIVDAFGGGKTSTLDLAGTSTGQVQIPEDIEASSFTLKVSSCPDDTGAETGFTKTIPLTSWNQYYDKNKLSLSDVDSSQGHLWGNVLNENMEKVKDKLKLTAKKGSNKETFSVKGGSFNITMEKTGEFQIKVTRTEMDSSIFDSDWVKVNVTEDTDYDGVIDSKDDCVTDEKDRDDVNEFGCVPITPKLIVKKGGKAVEDLKPGVNYDLELVGKNGTIDYDEKMKMPYGSKNYLVEFKNGVAGFTPPEPATYEFDFPDKPKYEGFSSNLVVEKGLFNMFNIGLGLIIAIVVIVLIVFIRKRGESSGGGKMFEGKMGGFSSKSETGPVVGKDVIEEED